ncbi:MAG: hypothetical protein JNM34_03875 [Chthonomonadaceae bacterium]|nr:hypothetical protein [Chthonomonadaceae bacterium]
MSAGEWPESGHGDGFFDKDTGLVSDEKAEFWIGYDDHHVYFAARAYTDPKKLVDEEYRQNVGLEGNDAFYLALDGMSLGQDFDVFAINPQGATSLRLAGGRAAKTEWIGDFESAGAKTPEGWLVEAAIPWTLIKRPSAGKRSLVFNVLWFRSNRSNTYEWVYTQEDFAKFPKWIDVNVPEVKKERTAKLLPYGYAGWDKEQGHVANFGLDLKSELTDSMTLVGTVNPDFRNVENAILSLDFSYFERLANESRPFFQEGSRYRSFGFDQRIFASQRIGDFDAGLNLYGEIGRTTLSWLATGDFGNRNSTALSTSTRLNDKSSIAASYVGNFQRGAQNSAGRLLYDQRVKDFTIYAGGMGTKDGVVGGGHQLTAGMFRESGPYTMFLDYSEVSPNFFPRLGFAPEKDFRSLFAEYGREIQPNGKTIRDYSFSVQGQYADHYHGGEYRRKAEGSFNVTFANRLRLASQAMVERFEGSNDHLVGFSLGYPQGSPYRGASINYQKGRFDGIDYKALSVQTRYRPVRRSQVNLSMQWTEYDEFSRQAILSANYDLSRDSAIGGRLVRRNDEWNWYLSYRLSGRRGNEYFLILGDPNTPEFRKTLVLKAVVPMTIRF